MNINLICNSFPNEIANPLVCDFSPEPGTVWMTPSPPRSGGEGRGEAARYFFIRTPLSASLPASQGESDRIWSANMGKSKGAG